MTAIIKKICSITIIFELTLVLGHYANSVHAGELREDMMNDRVSSSEVSLFIDNGLFNLRVDNATLEQVLEKLKEQVSVEFSFIDPDLGKQRMNSNINNMPLKYAMKTILEGYSYVFRNNKGLSKVYILSSTSMSYSGLNKKTVRFRPIEKVNYDENLLGNTEESYHHNLEQALRLIESGPLENQGDALEQLVGQDDERATQALIEAALSADDSHWGRNVTDALARHAAEFEYRDQEVISALQALADKSQVANQALQEMERFTQLAAESERE